MADPVKAVTLLTGDVINPDGFKLLYSGRAPVNSVGEGKDAYSFWKPVLSAENQKKYDFQTHSQKQTKNIPFNFAK